MNSINNRSLSLGGFSTPFNLFIEEDIYKPLINLELQSIKSPDEIVKDPKMLAKHLPDILVDLDITRLIKIIPNLILHMSETSKKRFSEEPILEKIDSSFLETVALAIPLEKRPSNIKEWSLFLAPETIDNVDPFVLAYLIPAIMDRLNNEDLVTVSTEIAHNLTSKDFKAITVPHYFDLEFSFIPQKLLLKNNGRTLIFKPQTGEEKSTVRFRDKKWEVDHAHIHIHSIEQGRENEGREYRFYKTRAEYEKTKNTSEDPNLRIIGEVHSIFKRVSGKNEKMKFMAVGIPLQLGSENEDLQCILDKLGKTKKILVGETEAVEVPASIFFQDIFMTGFSSHKVIYHSWGVSLPPPHLLSAGLKYNLIEKPILLSQAQYQFLKKLFGNLQELEPGKLLYPIDRKANYRKVRIL